MKANRYNYLALVTSSAGRALGSVRYGGGLGTTQDVLIRGSAGGVFARLAG